MHEQKPLWHEYWILLPSTRCLAFNQKLWDICCSITESCPALGNPMDCSMPAFPILHYLLELAQIHWADNAIQPSHPLLPSSPPALNLSQHQGLFQWVSSLHPLAKGLEPQLLHQSFQWIFGVDFLLDWLVWSPCNPRDSQESSPAPEFEHLKCFPDKHSGH